MQNYQHVSGKKNVYTHESVETVIVLGTVRDRNVTG